MRFLLPTNGAAVLLAVAVASGCSPGVTIHHSEPRVVSEGEERLEVNTTPLEDGSLLLHAERVRERRVEQTFWREPLPYRIKTSEVEPVTRVAGDPSMGTPQYSDSGLGWLALIVAGVYATIFAVAGVASVVAMATQVMVALVTVGKTYDDQRTTIERVEILRRHADSAVVESVGQEARIDLGPQPQNGWVLTPEMIQRLGGAGSTVLLRDGELSTEVHLATYK